jgi:hypothetical protein
MPKKKPSATIAGKSEQIASPLKGVSPDTTIPVKKAPAKNLKPKRAPIPADIETAVLTKSRRRCPLCVALPNDVTVKEGQIAHLDQNPANYAEDNLAFMCLAHHSVYDTTTRQHKNFTIHEVKQYRNQLYAFFAQGSTTQPAPTSPQKKERAVPHDESREAAREWQDLADRFRYVPGQTRADFQATDGLNSWTVKYNDKTTEALCRLAGAILLRSQAVLSQLPPHVKRDTEPLNLWLNYIQAYFRVGPSGFIGFDGQNKRLEQIGSVQDLQRKSAQLCMECSTIELMAGLNEAARGR